MVEIRRIYSAEQVLEIIKSKWPDEKLKTNAYTPIMRPSRLPFEVTSRHDCFGDARYFFYETVTEQDIPIWAAYLMSNMFLKNVAEEQQLENQPFSEDDFELTQSRSFQREIVTATDSFMKEVKDGKHKIPDMPSSYLNFPVSVHKMKCRRTYMEDRHSAVPSFGLIDFDNKYNKSNHAYFGVYDGHNGAYSSSYAASHFPEILLNEVSESGDIMEDILRAYNLVNTRMSIRAVHTRAKSGTTVVGAYIYDKKIYMFWCGDSVISVMDSEKVTIHSTAHKPYLEEEYKRIENSGGIIVEVSGELRVNGVLNLSRSMGEVLADKLIIATPDTKVYDIKEDDYFLILGSDGVWDYMSASEVYTIVTDFIRNKPVEEHENIAEAITDSAFKNNSTDNLTAIVVFLKPVEEVWEKFNKSEKNDSNPVS